jgi:hypothetical protein
MRQKSMVSFAVMPANHRNQNGATKLRHFLSIPGK